MNDWADQLGQPAGTPESTGDDWANSLTATKSNEARTLDANLMVPTTPDRSAKVLDLHKRTGLPINLVDSQLETVEQEAKKTDFDTEKFTKENPAVAKWMNENPQQASLGYSDHQNLSVLEKFLRVALTPVRSFFEDRPGEDTASEVVKKSTKQAGYMYLQSHGGIEQQIATIKEGRTFPITPEHAVEHAKKMGLIDKDAVVDVSQGLLDQPEILDAVMKAADDLERMDVERIQKTELYQKGAERFEFGQASIEELQPRVRPGSAKYYLGASTQAFFGSVLPMMGVSLATGGTAMPGLATMGTQVYGQRFGESLKEGRTIDQAKADAWFYSLAETIPEQIPLGIALKRGTPFFKKLFQASWTEATQEMFTEVLQAGYDAGVLDENMSLGDALRRVVDAGIIGALMGGSMATVVHAAQKPGDMIQKNRLKRQAKDQENFFKALGENATESKIREQLPDKYRELVDTLTKDGPVENVYTPIEFFQSKFEQAGVNPRQMAIDLGIVKQYDEAVEHGGKLAIPTSVYATKIAPTEFNADFAKELTITPDGLTSREMDDLQKEFEKAQEERQTATEEGVQMVFNDIQARVAAVSGPDVAEQVATVWAERARARADRLGVDPWEWYSKNQTEIVREGMAEAGVPRGTKQEESAQIVLKQQGMAPAQRMAGDLTKGPALTLTPNTVPGEGPYRVTHWLDGQPVRHEAFPDTETAQKAFQQALTETNATAEKMGETAIQEAVQFSQAPIPEKMEPGDIARLTRAEYIEQKIRDFEQARGKPLKPKERRMLELDMGGITKRAGAEHRRAVSQLVEQLMTTEDEEIPTLEFSFGEFQEDTPDESFMKEQAEDRYMSDKDWVKETRAEIAERYGKTLKQVTKQDILDVAIEKATNDYYDDPDRPSYRNISVTYGDQEFEFVQNYGYDESDLWMKDDPKGGSTITNETLDAKIEVAIQNYLEENLGVVVDPDYTTRHEKILDDLEGLNDYPDLADRLKGTSEDIRQKQIERAQRREKPRGVKIREAFQSALAQFDQIIRDPATDSQKREQARQRLLDMQRKATNELGSNGAIFLPWGAGGKNFRTFDTSIGHTMLKSMYQRYKKLGNNTYIVQRGLDYAVRLHNTDVVTYHENGDITLSSGGWHTPTTRDRLNRYSPFNVFSWRGKWVVGTGQQDFPFFDGIRFAKNINGEWVPSETKLKEEKISETYDWRTSIHRTSNYVDRANRMYLQDLEVKGQLKLAEVADITDYKGDADIVMDESVMDFNVAVRKDAPKKIKNLFEKVRKRESLNEDYTKAAHDVAMEKFWFDLIARSVKTKLWNADILSAFSNRVITWKDAREVLEKYFTEQGHGDLSISSWRSDPTFIDVAGEEMSATVYFEGEIRDSLRVQANMLDEVYKKIDPNFKTNYPNHSTVNTALRDIHQMANADQISATNDLQTMVAVAANYPMLSGDDRLIVLDYFKMGRTFVPANEYVQRLKSGNVFTSRRQEEATGIAVTFEPDEQVYTQTREEYAPKEIEGQGQYTPRLDHHRTVVKRAVMAGIEVKKDVLSDYPDLNMLVDAKPYYAMLDAYTDALNKRLGRNLVFDNGVRFGGEARKLLGNSLNFYPTKPMKLAKNVDSISDQDWDSLRENLQERLEELESDLWSKYGNSAASVFLPMELSEAQFMGRIDETYEHNITWVGDINVAEHQDLMEKFVPPHGQNIESKETNLGVVRMKPMMTWQRPVVMAALVDMIDMGMPKWMLDNVSVITTAEASGMSAGYSPDTGEIIINGRVHRLFPGVYDKDISMDAVAKNLRMVLLHEIAGHGFDHGNSNESHTADHPGFSIDGENLGPIMQEVYDFWKSEQPLHEWFNYPLDRLYDLVEDVKSKGETIGNIEMKRWVQSEVWAQIAALYWATPKLLSQHMPQAYNLYQEVVENADQAKSHGDRTRRISEAFRAHGSRYSVQDGQTDAAAQAATRAAGGQADTGVRVLPTYTGDRGRGAYRVDQPVRVRDNIPYGKQETQVPGEGAERVAVPSPARVPKPPAGNTRLAHFSDKADLTELDPSKHGTGIPGAESVRKRQDPANWVNRTYYGLNIGEAGGYIKEPGLGPNAYTVDLPTDRLYDFYNDPDGLAAKAQEEKSLKPQSNAINIYERLIRDAGYAGYRVGNAAAVFEKLSVKPMEFQQEDRGITKFGPNRSVRIELMKNADLSTLLHESGHVWLVEMYDDVQYLKGLGTLTAKQQGVIDDFEKTLKWLGITEQQLLTMDELSVKANEQFARGIEAYFAEGKAPSSELRSAFQRFKAWLVHVYRLWKNDPKVVLDVHLNDEVRGIMDRLLATDEQIAQARTESEIRPVFTDAVEAGMTDIEFSAYQKTLEDANEESKQNLEQQLMREFQRERTKWWKEERAKIRAEIETDVDQRPIYRALAELKREGGPRLDRKTVSERFKDRVKQLPTGVAVKEGGIDPDTAAEMMGFKSGEDLINQLSTMQTRNKVIEAETDQRMVQEHGNMLLDGSIFEKAREAVRDEKRSEIILRELKALQKKAREVKPFVEAAKKEGEEQKKAGKQIYLAAIPTVAQARETAQRTIAGTRIRDIRPMQYFAAARKASKSAIEAVNKGDFVLAAVLKRQEMIANEMYRAAVKAQAEVKKILDYLKKFDKKSTRERIGKVEGGFLDQIDALIARYNLHPQTEAVLAKKKAALREWYDAQVALGFEPTIDPDLMDESRRTNYKDVPLEDLQALQDAVKSIEYIASRIGKMKTIMGEKEYNDVVDLLVGKVEETLTKLPKAKEQILKSWLDRKKDMLKGHDVDLVSMETLIEILDGAAVGPWHDIVFNPASEAQSAEYDMAAEYGDVVGKIIDEYVGEDTSRILDMFQTDLQEEPMSRYKLLSIAFNLGNESNMEKMAKGHEWTEVQILEAVKKLDAKDLAFVQKIWDTLDTFYPKLNELQKKVSGVELARVQPRAVHLALNDGSKVDLKGGYYPASYDPDFSVQGQKQDTGPLAGLTEQGYARATAPDSFRKTRTKFAAPMRLDFGYVLQKHLAGVMKDLSHREFLIDMNRLLRDKRIRKVIQERLGREYEQMFVPWLRGIANDRNVSPADMTGWDKRFEMARSHVTVVALGFKVTSILAQIAGLPNALEYVSDQYGSRYMATALNDFIRSPFDSLDMVKQKSGEMRHRFETIDREVRDELRRMQSAHPIRGLSKLMLAKEMFERAAFYGINFMDRVVAVPTWMAAYQGAMDQMIKDSPGMDAALMEKRAVHAGDAAVRRSQGAGGAKDLSAIQRKRGVMKILTMFYTPFAAWYGRLRTIGGRMARSNNRWRYTPEAIMHVALITMIPTIMAELLAGRGPEDCKNKEGGDYAKCFGRWAAIKAGFSLAAPIPVVRDIANGLEHYAMDGRPRDTRFSPVLDAINRVATTTRRAGSVMFGDKPLEDDLVFDIFETSGYFMGFPTAQPRVTLEYLYDLMTDEAKAETPLEFMSGLAYRRKPDRSK